MKVIVLASFFAIFLLSGCNQAESERSQQQQEAEETEEVMNQQVVGPITIPLINRDGKLAGEATFTQVAETVVKIDLSIKWIEKGKHGIHLHETGECIPKDFSSAGGHYNPEDRHHGLKHEDGPHVGDLPNLNVTETGPFETTIMAEDVTLKASGYHALLAGDGTSLVIHEREDDYHSAPSGHSGARIMCGALNRKAL